MTSMLRFLITLAMLGAGWTANNSYDACAGNVPTATTAHFTGQCFVSPGDTWLLEEVVMWYSPQAPNTGSTQAGYTAQFMWSGRIELAEDEISFGTGTMIETPTRVGSVQVFIYWDGLTDNVNIRKGNYIAQLLLNHNPFTFPYVGEPELIDHGDRR
jgi:hypothetical protein